MCRSAERERTLKQADLGPVKRGASAELFLAKPGLLTESTQVGAEVLGDLERHSHHSASRRAK
jgi:hypothetical protein